MEESSRIHIHTCKSVSVLTKWLLVKEYPHMNTHTYTHTLYIHNTHTYMHNTQHT